MAEAQTMENRSVVIEENPEECFQESNVRLRLKKPKSKKKVIWREDTVDNEHMNKKKSKCCCIYEKPRPFGESSSESEDECENCRGHVENRNKKVTNSESSGMRVLSPEISQAL